MKNYPNKLCFSVSHTTRQPRPGEVHGVHYYFVKPEEFDALLAQNGFVEHAHVHGNHYGTSVKEIERLVGLNKLVVLDIDLQGCKLIKQNTDFLKRFNPFFLRVTVDLKELVFAFFFLQFIDFMCYTFFHRKLVLEREVQKQKNPCKPDCTMQAKKWNPSQISLISKLLTAILMKPLQRLQTHSRRTRFLLNSFRIYIYPSF